MNVLVLAGGLGTRLARVVGHLPKVMAPINGVPFLDYVLDQLRDQGFDRIILSVGYKCESIIKYYGDGSQLGICIEYSLEPRPLGTGGAIRKAEPLLDEEFLVVNGDSYLELKYDELIQFHHQRGSSITLALTRVWEPDRYGMVCIDESGRVKAFSHMGGNARAGLVSAGVYVMKKEVVLQIPKNAVVSLESDIFPKFANKNFYGMIVKGYFIDIGTPESYARAQTELLRKSRIK